jgi:hypothetical protein
VGGFLRQVKCVEPNPLAVGGELRRIIAKLSEPKVAVAEGALDTVDNMGPSSHMQLLSQIGRGLVGERRDRAVAARSSGGNNMAMGDHATWEGKKEKKSKVAAGRWWPFYAIGQPLHAPKFAARGYFWGML